MIKRLSVFLASALFIASPLAAHDTLEPGIWTNTEDAYFAEQEGRKKADWAGFEVSADTGWRVIDAFGAPQSDWSKSPISGLSWDDELGWKYGQSQLRKARPISCWVSVKKFAPKADGSDDWSFKSKLKSFDQGGRIFVSGEGAAPEVTIRIRNVTWAKGSRNKPSLVLYIHKQDPVRAESYSWASPDATLIGINLRWVQASCSRTKPTQGEN